MGYPNPCHVVVDWFDSGRNFHWHSYDQISPKGKVEAAAKEVPVIYLYSF
jgi:hypothetical protein